MKASICPTGASTSGCFIILNRKRSIGNETRLKIVPFGIFKEKHELRKGACYATHTIQIVRILVIIYMYSICG